MRVRFKHSLLLAVLATTFVLLLPRWIERKGWENLGMGWVWFLLFFVLLWTNFVEDYSRNQAVRALRSWQHQLLKRVDETQKQRPVKMDAGKPARKRSGRKIKKRKNVAAS